jgi:hypothetical protein
MVENGIKTKSGSISIEEVERLMLLDTSDIECTTKHHFSDGVYVREITMPTGSVILGAEHTTTHFNIISKGACILLDLDEGTRTEIIAPCTFESKAGVRKLLYIVEECVWSTVHVTNETDVEKLEAELTTMSDTYKEIMGTDKFIEGGKANGILGNRSNGRFFTS